MPESALEMGNLKKLHYDMTRYTILTPYPVGLALMNYQKLIKIIIQIYIMNSRDFYADLKEKAEKGTEPEKQWFNWAGSIERLAWPLKSSRQEWRREAVGCCSRLLFANKIVIADRMTMYATGTCLESEYPGPSIGPRSTPGFNYLCEPPASLSVGFSLKESSFEVDSKSRSDNHSSAFAKSGSKSSACSQ
jgi:hypothetical protein